MSLIWRYLALALLLSTAVCAVGWWITAERLDASRTASIRENNRALVAVDKMQQAWTRAVYDIAFTARMQENSNVAETDRVIADLRDRKLSVQPRLQCRASEGTTAPGRVDGPATGGSDAGGITDADAEFLVRYAGQCAALSLKVQAWQRYGEAVMKFNEGLQR